MKRRGFLAWDVAIAVLLIGVLTTVCLNFVAAVNGQRKEQYAHLAAEQEAANAMERLAAVPWDDLPKPSSQEQSLSSQAKRVLPEGRVKISVGESGGSPTARRVEVTVSWRPQIGGLEHKARLVAWRYKLP